MKVKVLKVIKASGNPYNVGFIYGKEAKNKIVRNLNIYNNILQEVTGISWEKIKERVKSGLGEIESFDKRAVEVMRGIADGANVLFDEILTLNYRYELLFSQKICSCTSIGVQTNKLTIIAQNWDFRKDLENSLVNLEFKINGCPKVFTQVEAGLLSHRGLNSNGIALCINALRSKDDELKFAIPLVSVLPWLVLNSNSITKAIELINQAKRYSSINYLIACNEMVLDIELTPKDFEYMEPNEDGLIVHTNHFLCERFKGVGKSVSACSLTRQLRANYLIRRLKDKDVEEVKSILRDHYDYPYSICRHEADRQGSLGIAKTLASSIISVSDSEFYYTVGNPCLSEYVKVRVQ